MSLSCQRCGAPLAPTPGARYVKCGYCNATADLAAIAPQQPPAFVVRSPHAPTPEQVRARAHVAAPAAGRSALASVVVALVVAAVGAGVAYRAASRGAAGIGGIGGIGGIVGSGPATWNATTGCFVDADGDGVFDVVGLAGAAGTPTTPMVVSGATGKVVWQGPAAATDSVVACPDSGAFILSRPDFSYEVRDARRPDPPRFVQRARDKLRSVTAGKGCWKLDIADGSVIGLDPSSGQQKACTAEARSPFDKPGIIGLTGERTELALGDKVVGLTKRQMGTPMLTLDVRAPNRPKQVIELDYSAPTFGTGLALAPGKVFLFAAKASARDVGIVVALDEAGKVLAQRPLEKITSWDVHFFAFNGRYLVAQYYAGLAAFDPATLEPVWTLGIT